MARVARGRSLREAQPRAGGRRAGPGRALSAASAELTGSSVPQRCGEAGGAGQSASPSAPLRESFDAGVLLAVAVRNAAAAAVIGFKTRWSAVTVRF